MEEKNDAVQNEKSKSANARENDVYNKCLFITTTKLGFTAVGGSDTLDGLCSISWQSGSARRGGG